MSQFCHPASTNIGSTSCTPRTRHMPARVRGYVLILTIAALALLALVGAFIGQQVSSALRLAAAEQEYARDLRLAQDTLATHVYLVATTQRTAAGIGSDQTLIRFDGRWYDAGNGMAISFIDGRGLINMRNAPREWQQRLLATYGLSAETITALLDALEDYVDNDSLRRIQGAEKDDYLRKNLNPPRDFPIMSRHELLSVYGWKETDALWGQDPVLNHVVVDDVTGVNPATATWRSMVAAFGISESVAKDFVLERNKHDPVTAVNFANIYDAQTTGDDFMKLHKGIAFPSSTTILRVGKPGSNKAWQISFSLTPESTRGPWVIQDWSEMALDTPPADKLEKIPDLTPYRASFENAKKGMGFLQ